MFAMMVVGLVMGIVCYFPSIDRLASHACTGERTGPKGQGLCSGAYYKVQVLCLERFR